jgi:uncharacterized DUF497 family protein
MRFVWDHEKNEKLKRERGVSFEQVVFHIAQGDLLDILKHPNQARYPGQQVFVVKISGYAFLAPFIEDEDRIILKTIIPSRKATARYLAGDRSKP